MKREAYRNTGRNKEGNKMRKGILLAVAAVSAMAGTSRAEDQIRFKSSRASSGSARKSLVNSSQTRILRLNHRKKRVITGEKTWNSVGEYGIIETLDIETFRR